MTALKRLLARLGDRELRQQAESVLEDEYADPDRFRELALKYADERDDLDDHTRGALGFVHLVWVVDRVRGGVDDKSELEGLLADEAVRDFLREAYELGDYELGEVVAVGETSFVVECDGRTALKLLLPWFRVSPTLRHELDEYVARIRPVRRVTQEDVVYVEARGPGWVALNFVPGELTLAEALDELRRATAMKKEEIERRGEPFDEARVVVTERLPIMRVLARGLTRCIAQLERCGLHHGDLRPENVVLENGDFARPVLVDFGPPPEALKRAATEPILTRRLPTLADDLKALATLLLACLVPLPPQREPSDPELSSQELEQRAVDRAHESLQHAAPRVAMVLEGLLRREGRVPSGNTVWEELEKELDAFEELSGGDPDPLTAIRIPDWKRVLHRPSELLKLRDVFWQARYRKRLDRVSRRFADSDWPVVERWMRRYAFSWKLTLSVFTLLTLFEFFGLSSLPFGIDGGKIHERLGRLYAWEPGKPPSHLLLLDYRLVSLTTAGIAFVYYLNIFSTLRAADLSRSLERLMRWGPLVAIAMQVAAMIFFPFGFAWIAGAGGLFVSVHNLWWLRRMKTALGEHSAAYESFRQWPFLMFVFCFGGIAIGVLLNVGLIGDAWFYAVALTALSCIKVFPQNCTRDAPKARAWLTLTAYLGSRRESRPVGEAERADAAQAVTA